MKNIASEFESLDNYKMQIDKKIQKHKKNKKCKKSNEIRNCTLAPAISTSYSLNSSIGNLFNLLKKPLQRMTAGGILTEMEKTYAKIPVVERCTNVFSNMHIWQTKNRNTKISHKRITNAPTDISYLSVARLPRRRVSCPPAVSPISYQLTFEARAEVALLSSESATGTLNIENRR